VSDGAEETTRIDPPADVGRRYADASGDHNPIHVDAAAARAVGLPGPILHGMWTLAQAANLVAEDPFALEAIAVEFRGIGLPGEPVEVTVRRDADGRGATFAAAQGPRELLRNGRAALRP